ncbi:hypothetical protein [Gryllotalpicola ginsengisoli]|uniref:hypothetical protein n=1 Tax=Gryllotalpicola ginsengisoli TaxID=444608 RepID=UPI0003B3A0C7|nr:hypothetical protein [Gryllotalpicola ginsengisoli]
MWIDTDRTVNVRMIPQPWHVFDDEIQERLRALSPSDADALEAALFELRQHEFSAAKAAADRMADGELAAEGEYRDVSPAELPLIFRHAERGLEDDVLAQVRALEPRFRLDVAIYAEDGLRAIREASRPKRSWTRWFRRS